MELEKQYIHMNREEAYAETQISLEKDYLLSDSSEDIHRILLTDTEVHTEENRVGENQIEIKGSVLVRFLYQPDLGMKNLCSASFRIPYEDVIKIDGIQPSSHPELNIEVDKSNLALINPRKVTFRGTLSVCCTSQSIADEEIGCGIVTDEDCEIKTAKHSCMSLSCMKTDMFRIREEMKLPGSAEPIRSILWHDLKIRDFEVRPMREQLHIRGEVNAFFIYLGDDDEFHFKEGSIPFHGTMECEGCAEESIVNVSCMIERKECEIRPDDDGEDRIFGIDLNLRLNILIYEQMEVSCLEDAYGCRSDIVLEKSNADCMKVLYHSADQFRVDQTVNKPSGNETIDTIHYSCFEPDITRVTRQDSNLVVNGILNVQMLYTVTDDRFPYRSSCIQVPFSHSINIMDLTENTDYQIQASPENISVSVFDSESLQVKAVVGLQIFATCKNNLETVCSINDTPLSAGELKKTSKITIFFPDKGPNRLWDVGKETRVPLKRIRELNGLPAEAECFKDKIIIMK